MSFRDGKSSSIPKTKPGYCHNDGLYTTVQSFELESFSFEYEVFLTVSQQLYTFFFVYFRIYLRVGFCFYKKFSFLYNI
jgi:hypothetical protein